MPTVVYVEGVGNISFPDSMSPKQIEEEINRYVSDENFWVGQNKKPPAASAAETPEEAYRKQTEKNYPGMISGLAQQFTQGISLGGADELQAAAEALGSGDYRGSLERQRLEREAFQFRNPYLSAAATGFGAITPVVMATLGGAAGGTLAAPGPGTLAGGAAGASAAGSRAVQLAMNAMYGGGGAPRRGVQTVLQAAGEGARVGVVPGILAGALTANPDERAGGAVMGGLLGYGLGGAVGGGMQSLSRLSDMASPYLKRITQLLGAGRSGVSPMAPLTPEASQFAPITSAEEKILKAMETGGVSPEVAAAQLEQSRRLGVPLGLVDVGGQPVQRLARSVRTLPGEGSAIIQGELERRAAGQPGRVVRMVERALGRRSTGNVGAREDELTNRARSESAPFYGQLEGLPPLSEPDLLSLFNIPRVQDVVRRSEAARRGWGGSVDPLYDDTGALRRQPTFRDVDRIKQNLDEILKPQYQQGPRPADAVAIDTREERNMVDALRRQLLSAADVAPGGDIYARARASYASPAQAREALEAGSEFPKSSLQDVISMTGTASPAQLKWYQRGVSEALRENIEGMKDIVSQPNVLRSVVGSPVERAKLAAVTPERRQAFLQGRIAGERTAAQTNAFLRGNSQTVDKALEAADTTVDTVANVAAGGNLQSLLQTGKTIYKAVINGVNEKTRAEIGRQLTNFDNPAAQIEFLNRLIRLKQKGELRAQDVAANARAMAAGAQTSGLLSPEL